MTIWGNHSDTQYPDYKNAQIGGRPATEVITDPAWFTETFIPTVAKRGAAVIKARGRLVGGLGGQRRARQRPLAPRSPPPAGDWFSAGVVSDGSYGIPAGLIYSFPLRSSDGKTWSIVQGLPIDDDARKRLDASAAELDRRARRRQGPARPGGLSEDRKVAGEGFHARRGDAEEEGKNLLHLSLRLRASA